ncbi:hypothetical protein H4582DRAFT_1937640 [Lactarius indigo]|nr:hypothetical protein H4582DRAFT_1937640 [Lactarius indigo]
MGGVSTELLVDGYISRAFNPKGAEEYFSHLLKTKNWKVLHLTLPSPREPSVVFVIQEASRHLQTPPFMDSNGVPFWLLDYAIKEPGTVVPQTLWIPHHKNDLKQHVEEANLQLPIFFIHGNGSLGLSLEAAALGQCRTLRDANVHAQLGGKNHHTHPNLGYQDFKRQVQIRDETTAHNPITVAKFAQHVGRSVDAFLGFVSKENLNSSKPNWEIGNSGINRANIRVIGAVHVSAGSWMPILQLNFYVI